MTDRLPVHWHAGAASVHQRVGKRDLQRFGLGDSPRFSAECIESVCLIHQDTVDLLGLLRIFYLPRYPSQKGKRLAPFLMGVPGLKCASG